jgi:hypothetical protein
MADNVPITAGSGTDVATDDVSGVHFQRVKLVDGTLDSSAAIPGDATNGLDVDVTRVQGTVTVSATNLDVRDLAQTQDNVKVGDGTSFIDIDTAPTDGETNGGKRLLHTEAWLWGYNGTSWDRLRSDTTNGLDVDVTRLPALAAGTANIGDVDVLTLPALPAGTNNIGDVDVLTQPARAHGTDSIKVGDGTNFIGIATAGADGESNTANRLRTESYNDVFNGSTWDRQKGDLAGTWVRPFAGRGSLKSGATAAITDTTSTQVIAGTASNYLYITSVSVWNSSAVDTYVKLQDGSGGTTLYNVPSPKGGGAVITFPSPLLVPTLGNGLFAAPNASANATLVSATGYISTV